MRKIFKLLFLLLAYQGYAQYAPFKGVFHEGGYAVYAYHPGDVSDFVPYKMYIFEERETITNGVVSAGYWVYDRRIQVINAIFCSVIVDNCKNISFGVK